MKIAIVYDYLNQYGGGERVLENLLELFPTADLFTLFFDADKTFGKISPHRLKRASFLNRPVVINNHRLFIPLMPRAAASLNLGHEYDLILSVGAGYSKGISYQSSYHISYCFTPLRYAWNSKRYLSKKFGWKYFFMKPLLLPLTAYLKSWDWAAGQKPDELIAISSHISEQIRDYYLRNSKIIFPPVDLNIFYPERTYRERQYFLAAGRLMHYKNFDSIILAFNELKLPLKILGRGPELKKLIKLNTSPETHFITSLVKDGDLRSLYSNALALIFPQIEDFGLVAAEAIACGTPVIALKAGGPIDIIQEGLNGVFLENQSSFAITNAINSLPSYKFDSHVISKTAAKFSRQKFEREFLEIVNGFTQ